MRKDTLHYGVWVGMVLAYMAWHLRWFYTEQSFLPGELQAVFTVNTHNKFPSVNLFVVTVN